METYHWPGFHFIVCLGLAQAHQPVTDSQRQVGEIDGASGQWPQRPEWLGQIRRIYAAGECLTMYHCYGHAIVAIARRIVLMELREGKDNNTK